MTLEEAIADLMLAQADVFYRPKDDSIDMAIEALENQKSIIEEFEKIKHEIQEEMEDYLMEVDYIMGVKDGLLFSAEIVNRHIKENKQ